VTTASVYKPFSHAEQPQLNGREDELSTGLPGLGDKWIYTLIVDSHSTNSGMDHSFTCKLYHAYLYLISIIRRHHYWLWWQTSSCSLLLIYRPW